MVTLEDFTNKGLAALGVLILSWAGYITSQVIDAPSKADLDKVVEREVHSVDKSIKDLFDMIHKVNSDIERLKDGIGGNNDKIIVNNEKIWSQIGVIQIEIERAKLWRDMYNQDLQELKKKRIGEIRPGWSPNTDQADPPVWRTF